MRPGDGRRKHADNKTPGPWMRWRGSRHARAIRFIEKYLRSPKGVGFGMPMRLAAFQKELLEEWYASGVNSAAISLPRGNGKSTFLAAVAVESLFADSQYGAPSIPIVATTVGQAIRSVYATASAMVAADDELATRSIPYTNLATPRIVVPSNGGEMFPIANHIDGLQGLDPSLAILDEVGFNSVAVWDSLLLAAGKRPRSLVVGIGTPGLTKEDNALWTLREAYLSGRDLPGFLYREWSADPNADHADESEWYRANPALAEGYLDIDALRTALALSPEASFRTFRLGQWIEGVDCWLGQDGRDVWRALVSPWDFIDGADMWVGVDVGLKRDSTAVVAVQKREDGRAHAKARIWQPTKEQPVDITEVVQHIRDLSKQYKLREVAFDPRLFDYPAKFLQDEKLPMVEFPQSVERMTGAVGNLYTAIKDGRVSHDGAQDFEHQVLNAVPRFNERGFTLQKSKSRGKIDAAIALSMAVDRALFAKKRAPLVIA